MRYTGRRSITDIVHDNMWAAKVNKPPRFAYRNIQKTRRAFVSWLTRTGEEEASENFPIKELMEETILLITTRGDTSSTTICATMYCLLHAPDKRARLQKEVCRAFPSMEDIGLDAAMHSCTYLRACADEALRMAPPAGSVLRREGEAGGSPSTGRTSPGAPNIGVPVFAIHHDPAYVAEPFAYQPERWIAGETLADGTAVTPEVAKHAQSAFMPFSAGMRGSIGKPLAYLAISILYATLVHRFDLRLCPDKWVNWRKSGSGPDPTTEYELRDIFTSWENGPLVEVCAGISIPAVRIPGVDYY
ncbi:hypothetical protein DL767_006204 [Monosporascus sp. MG133]|nr:hypothetical protein DL767_006204 [Monosporascus sp. MG133]